MAICEMRPETKAGPILRARNAENVRSPMGSFAAPPRPPRPASAAGGSACATAASQPLKKSGINLMDGSITHVRARMPGVSEAFVGFGGLVGFRGFFIFV